VVQALLGRYWERINGWRPCHRPSRPHIEPRLEDLDTLRTRRFLIPLAVFLIVLTVAGATGPGPNQAEKPDLPPGREADASATVTGRLPADRVVEARVGDVVQIEVTPREAGGVEIPAFAQIASADPEVPARFSLLVDRPGRFVVRTVEGRAELGYVEVAAD
jgi:hypothetical protein